VIYETKNGPALHVRSETRYGSKEPEHMTVSVQKRQIVTRWYKELPSDFVLIHNPEAQIETEVANLEANALVAEKEVLLKLSLIHISRLLHNSLAIARCPHINRCVAMSSNHHRLTSTDSTTSDRCCCVCVDGRWCGHCHVCMYGHRWCVHDRMTLPVVVYTSSYGRRR